MWEKTYVCINLPPIPWRTHNSRPAIPAQIPPSEGSLLASFGVAGTLLAPRAPMVRLIREILHDNHGKFCLQAAATTALQEAAEKYITDILTFAGEVCIHRKKTTLKPEDIQLVRKIRDGVNGKKD